MIKQQHLYTLARIIVIFMMFQTLYAKFTAQPEAVENFSQLFWGRWEPNARIWIGIIELIAGSLLLAKPPYRRWWAALAFWLMIWAIYFHVTILGINNLFISACVTLVASWYLLYTDKQEILSYTSKRTNTWKKE